MNLKIKIIFIIIISISVFIVIFKKNITNNEVFFTNSVIIEKPAEIIKNWTNPLGILLKDKNITKNIFSWLFIWKNKVITALHWTNWDNISYKVTDFENNIYTAKLSETNKSLDIAILETTKENKKYSDVKIETKINIWEEVYTFSNIDWQIIKKWQIVKIENWKIYSNIKLKYWNSWSGLFNQKWKLIWINIEYDIKNNLSIAIWIK